jgi:hypothetical protein
MTTSTRDPSLASLADPRLAALIDELTDRFQAGEAVDLEAFIGQHPSMPGRSGNSSPRWRL